MNIHSTGAAAGHAPVLARNVVAILVSAPPREAPRDRMVTLRFRRPHGTSGGISLAAPRKGRAARNVQDHESPIA